ncbi:MAG: methionyl-tRNA formyltransferase [Chitinophagaceae bacterium]
MVEKNISNFKSDLRIVFMGTPEFAVPSLDKLLQSEYNIVGVITAPDRPAGRGMNVQQSAIKKFAAEKGLQILQPVKLKDPEFLQQLQSLKADLQIVVAFRMLPEVVWNMPPMGTVNLHGSMLPQYRGAAPINWAIINGEKETGATTFKLQHQIDTGNILLQQKIIIGDDETAGELNDKMKAVGADLLLRTVNGLINESFTETPQSSSDQEGQTILREAPKISTENLKINWNKNVDEVYNLIRGLSPYPAAFTLLNNKTLKIYKSQKEIIQPIIAEGNFETDKKTFLKFACTNGYISIKELQLEGKKRMSIEDFLRGFHF